MKRRPPRSTLFLHDALPIYAEVGSRRPPPLAGKARRAACAGGFPGNGPSRTGRQRLGPRRQLGRPVGTSRARCASRSEEHTSELQSQFHLVCRLLLEKKKKT